jgi:carboxyl-terminal processing protease
MLSHLDPYTTYIDPDTLSQFERDIRKNYSGIGIQIRKHAERDELLVVTPIKGSPAYKAGIKAGDIITTIKRDVDSDGNPLDKTEVIETKGLPLNDAVKKVLGKPNTKVKLVVERDGKAFDLEITRATIELETVMGFKRNTDDSWDYMIDPESKIAYIRLTGFAGNTARDLSRVMAKLDDQGVKGVILDLRFNPGGLLRSAVTISDLFIDDGPIVSVRPRVGREEKHTGRRAGSYLNFPMVCLVNSGSASASEIVSACLQDHKRAVIMGERSYGKGSVQNIQPFDGGQLKLTIATFWRPSNKNLNKSSTPGKDDDEWGVTPDKDFILKLTRTDREALAEYQHDTEVIRPRDAKEKQPDFKDRQRDMAVEYLQKQIRTASK